MSTRSPPKVARDMAILLAGSLAIKSRNILTANERGVTDRRRGIQ